MVNKPTKKAPAARIAFLAAFLVAALALIPVALAGKGGSNATGTGGSTGVKITFAPAAVVVGQQYQVNGSGFKPNTWVTVGAHYSDVTWWNSGVTDGQGKISLSFTATSAGQVYHEADQLGNNDRQRLMASATLTVSP